MDYDQTNMPENYDHGRKPVPGMVEMWMDCLADEVQGHSIKTIIDLGCGTGRFTAALAQRFGASVIGVDPSEKMLAQAATKAANPSVEFRRGSAESLPCEDRSADMIFASMAFHHFKSKSSAAHECRRVLRPTGVVFIRNSSKERQFPYDRYFPNYNSSLGYLPSSDEIATAFCDNGFKLKRHQAIPHTMARTTAELAEKAAFRADTTLQLLSDADFETGMRSLRSAPESGPVMMDVDLFTFVVAH